MQLFTFDLVLKIIQFILLPFSMLYGLVLRLRHLLYDGGLISRNTSRIPLIGVGNLSFGGTGKSPFTIFLANFLTSKGMNVAIVSRGYNRKTKGTLLADKNSTAREIGDEPFMYTRLLPNVPIVVSENRIEGIRLLENQKTSPEVIILDDCYQHLKVKPDILFLLTTQKKPFWKDFLVPSGYLRDIKIAARKRHALVITKCNNDFSFNEVPPKYLSKPLFSSMINYEPLTNVFNGKGLPGDFITFSALADSTEFDTYANSQYNIIRAFHFKDHHYFSTKELLEMISFATQKNNTCGILTTEKDFYRLDKEQIQLFDKTDFYVLPITIKINEMSVFDEFIISQLSMKE